MLRATQEMADFDRVAPGLRDQVLGNTAFKVAHRQDVPASAQTIAQMAGTEKTWEYTERVGGGPFGRLRNRPRHPAPGRAVRDPPERDQDAGHRAGGLISKSQGAPRASTLRGRPAEPPRSGPRPRIRGPALG